MNSVRVLADEDNETETVAAEQMTLPDEQAQVTEEPVRPQPLSRPRFGVGRPKRIVVRRPIKIYEEDETIDIACQEGRCRHNWHGGSDCDDVFCSDHDSHQGDRRAERALRPGSVRSSERIAAVEAEREDRLADFVQRVMLNESSDSDQDLPPPVVACTLPNCNCVAHSQNSVFASDQNTDRSFEATPTMLTQASKSLETSDSGK